jgi:hypothetical protein
MQLPHPIGPRAGLGGARSRRRPRLTRRLLHLVRGRGERKLKEWALQQGWNDRRISEESASRILISALGSLAGSYDA